MNLYDVLRSLIEHAAVPPALANDMRKVVDEVEKMNGLGGLSLEEHSAHDCDWQLVSRPIIDRYGYAAGNTVHKCRLCGRRKELK